MQNLILYKYNNNLYFKIENTFKILYYDTDGVFKNLSCMCT